MRLVLGVLAARHQRGGLVERLLERGAARERVLEERLAEPGELTVVLAAKGGVRGIGCGNDRRGVALELVEKDTRVARRHHHHAPADLGIIERLAQIRGRQLRERQRSEEHTSELQSPDTISYAVFCLKTKKQTLRNIYFALLDVIEQDSECNELM